MAASEDFATLYRYFIWTDRMFSLFEKTLGDPKYKELGDPMIFLADDPGIFMSYWYGGLYVVIEGFRELRLSDPKINLLLTSPNVELLRLFRNGAFHYQKKWLHKKVTDFCGTPDGVKWVRELTAEFRRYFVNEMEKRK